MYKDSERVRQKQYDNCLKQSSWLYQPLAGCSGMPDDATTVVSNYVVGPSIAGYVMWMLKEAVANGVDRLYFLARDAYFMYQTARAFCKKLSLPIECRYLYCSRYSLRIPMFHLDITEALEYVCRGGVDVTMTKLLSRAGLTENERDEVLKLLDLDLKKDEEIPYARLTEIKNRLAQCEIFLNLMRRHSEEAMPGLEGYIRQEGLLDDVRIAIADSGWVGSMQKVLNRLLVILGRANEVEGYYWGLYEVPDGTDASKYHCFFFGPKGNIREKVYFNNCVFEAVCTAPHGMTLGYRKKGEEYEPVYASIEEEHLRFVRETEQHVMGYVDKLSETISEAPVISTKIDLAVIGQLMKLFMCDPTGEEAEVYGRLQFSDDVLTHKGQELADKLSEAQLKANHVLRKALAMLGVNKEYIRESAWYEGSAVRGQRNEWYHLWQYTLYKYLRYVRKTYM